MGQTVHHYPGFETAAELCGNAWNNWASDASGCRLGVPKPSNGILMRSDARRLTRRADAGVIEAVALMKRYFEGDMAAPTSAAT